jgi:hypothetical protein
LNEENVMFANNENRKRLADAINKNIVHVERPNRREMPGGLLSMVPLSGAAAPQQMAASTTAASALSPFVGNTGAKVTPDGAKISANVKAGLSKQAPGVEQRVNDFLRRKV